MVRSPSVVDTTSSCPVDAESGVEDGVRCAGIVECERVSSGRLSPCAGCHTNSECWVTRQGGFSSRLVMVELTMQPLRAMVDDASNKEREVVVDGVKESVQLERGE